MEGEVEEIQSRQHRDIGTGVETDVVVPDPLYLNL